MQSLQTLLSRIRKADATASSGGESHADSPNAKVPVPPDHVVTIYRPVTEPDLCRTHGGTLIANLGSASDEFKEELTRISDEIENHVPIDEALQRGKPTPILLATDARRLSDLFAPNDVAVGTLAGLVLWVVDAGERPTLGFAIPSRSGQPSAALEPIVSTGSR